MSTATIDGRKAESHFKAGLALEEKGDRLGALGEYRLAAAGGDPEHLFRLAYSLDLVGEEEEAVRAYEQAVSRSPAHVNALINLAILYEDRGEIAKAEKCLKQVLDTNPGHARAKLYIRDVRASRDMYYDEEHARDVAKRSAVLDTPVTDFELSVRARNCLRKIGVRTLGDLVKISEAELLGYKNFGETSLTEIKEMLQSKNLRLGQAIEGSGGRGRPAEKLAHVKGKVSESVLNKPVSALELTLRPRRAVQQLGIQTLGELAARTEAELMGVKNFGANSLDEIRAKLAEFGLSLRKLD
ncbi:MAG TPA: DNA-directed RNA polymerase subunit alpha C-terminal domain-containing protein [Phycisphaerales bacterium]|nr:DNA-directed RNA polymerase subunit alpha C-terminal domain-containing protein [Phycisphaerales bacterium]HMP36827.1 DNA-directed RNA polymerase subunit alpha C-terminal domain-containing protein [Phycisphaerales bacterium]